jgi:hypothetical protein
VKGVLKPSSATQIAAPNDTSPVVFQDDQDELIASLNIKPPNVMSIARGMTQEILRSGPLTIDQTPSLMIGPDIEKDYGLLMLWVLDAVNEKYVGFIAINPFTGQIIKQHKIER